MQLGALLPLGDIGGDPGVVREFAQTAEAIGYDFLEAPDHVLGVNAASRPGWDGNTSEDLFHDPFVLFGYLAGCTTKLGFSTGVLILPQRQTVLVAKQAGALGVLWGGGFPARVGRACDAGGSGSGAGWGGTRLSTPGSTRISTTGDAVPRNRCRSCKRCGPSRTSP